MRQVLLRRRPAGRPAADDFEIVDAPAPVAGDGGVLRRTIYLSLDPYMRGRMSDAESYATPVALGQVTVGHTVSQVVDSRNPAFATGDFVAGYDGWRERAVSDGSDLRKLDPIPRRHRGGVGTGAGRTPQAVRWNKLRQASRKGV